MRIEVRGNCSATGRTLHQTKPMPIIPILIVVPLILAGAAVLAVGCAPHLWEREWNRVNSELGNNQPAATGRTLHRVAEGERKVA